MNREILFRGLRTDGKGWVYGCLVIVEQSCFIHRSEKRKGSLDDFIWQESVEVLPSSVGQFNDRYNCYEGDRVMASWEDEAKGGYFQMSDSYVERKEFGVCVWYNGAFLFKNEKTGKFINFPHKATITVTGNIHEGGNP